MLLAAIAFLRGKGEVQYSGEISRLEAELDNCERIEERIECEVTATSDNELYVVTDDELAVLSPIWHNIVSLLRALELSRGGIYTSISRNGGAFCKKLLAEDPFYNTAAAKPKQHYATRKFVSVALAAKVTGLSISTIKRLDKNPQNTNYPGRNSTVKILAAWGDMHRRMKLASREVNAANRPEFGLSRT